MSFLNKLKYGLIRFMTGRNGVDLLSYALILASFALNLLEIFLRTGVLSLLSEILLVWSLFRALSKNIAKRRAENMKFMLWVNKIRPFVLRYWTRLKNIRTYKYFSCPQCKASIRMKRGMGEKEITCPGCKHVFKQKS